MLRTGNTRLRGHEPAHKGHRLPPGTACTASCPSLGGGGGLGACPRMRPPHVWGKHPLQQHAARPCLCSSWTPPQECLFCAGDTRTLAANGRRKCTPPPCCMCGPTFIAAELCGLCCTATPTCALISWNRLINSKPRLPGSRSSAAYAVYCRPGRAGHWR